MAKKAKKTAKKEDAAKLIGVKKADVPDVVESFLADRAYSVQAWKEGAQGQLWTVRALFRVRR